MRLSGCIESLFTAEQSIVEDRIRLCADAGLDAVEFWQWRDKDLDKIERELGETGLALSLFSVEPRSPIVDRATHREFVAATRDSVRVAQRLGALGLCVLADDRGVGGGETPRTGVTRAEQHAAIVAALKLAAPIAADAGVKLFVEPLNSVLDHKGHFLDHAVEGLDIVEEVDNPSVLLLYDMYHSTMMGELPETVLGDRAGLVGHVHVADVPGRHEPGSGTINWPAYMATLASKGYAGFIGLEYWASRSTLDSLRLTRTQLTAGR